MKTVDRREIQMNYKERKFYKQNLQEVLHTNLNPYEPGVVRIHLVPAKYNPFKADPSVVILNGKDILPIGLAWTILLAIFIKEVNSYQGNEITEEQLEKVVNTTVNKALEVYRKPRKNYFKRRLKSNIICIYRYCRRKRTKRTNRTTIYWKIC